MRGESVNTSAFRARKHPLHPPFGCSDWPPPLTSLVYWLEPRSRSPRGLGTAVSEMASYFDEHDCESLDPEGDARTNILLEIARWVRGAGRRRRAHVSGSGPAGEGGLPGAAESRGGRMDVLELVRRLDLRESGYFGSTAGLPGRGFREDELVDWGKSGWRWAKGAVGAWPGGGTTSSPALSLGIWLPRSFLRGPSSFSEPVGCLICTMGINSLRGWGCDSSCKPFLALLLI